MAKLKARYVCQACGSVSHRWQGQCADCAEWNTLVQESAEVSSIFAAKHDLSGRRAGDPAGRARQAAAALPSGCRAGSPSSTARSAAGSCRDRRCWSAAIPGSASRPCCSRSRRGWPSAGSGVVYVSGEESAEQVRLRAVRLGLGERAGAARRGDLGARHLDDARRDDAAGAAGHRFDPDHALAT